MGTFILVLLAITGMFLIFIILLQRGRGGGLAGALGGPGGQSAFGTKAGDVFTRVTVGVALFWVLLACTAGFFTQDKSLYPGGSAATDEQQIVPGDQENAAGDGDTKPRGADDESLDLAPAAESDGDESATAIDPDQKQESGDSPPNGAN